MELLTTSQRPDSDPGFMAPGSMHITPSSAASLLFLPCHWDLTSLLLTVVLFFLFGRKEALQISRIFLGGSERRDCAILFRRNSLCRALEARKALLIRRMVRFEEFWAQDED